MKDNLWWNMAFDEIQHLEKMTFDNQNSSSPNYRLLEQIGGRLSFRKMLLEGTIPVNNSLLTGTWSLSIIPYWRNKRKWYQPQKWMCGAVIYYCQTIQIQGKMDPINSIIGSLSKRNYWQGQSLSIKNYWQGWSLSIRNYWQGRSLSITSFK